MNASTRSTAPFYPARSPQKRRSRCAAGVPTGAPKEFELLRLLEVFEPEMLSYSPSGFEVRMAHTELFTPGVEALRAQWSGFL